MQVGVRLQIRWLAVVWLLIAAGLTGCTRIENTLERVLPRSGTEYQTSGSLPPLEVPPGLTSSSIKDAYPVGSERGTATYSDYTNRDTNGGQGKSRATAQESVAGVLPVVPDIAVERSGDKRWLVVEATPGEIWPRLRDFWLENGFLIAFEDPSIGIMETGWAEKREELPVGALKRLIAKIQTAAYTFGTRDRFRVRLERGERKGTTEIYLSHRGAKEEPLKDSTDYTWIPRPADPELEAEMLQRMMVSFGFEQQDAKRLLVAKRPSRSRAEIVQDTQGGAVLALREDFARAWRRTGLALDRVGFTVEDRDRSRGLFYVRYVDPLADEIKPSSGWFDKLKFWGGDKAPPVSEFLISLVGSESTTQVLVLDKTGRRERSGTSERILSLLQEQLR